MIIIEQTRSKMQNVWYRTSTIFIIVLLIVAIVSPILVLVTVTIDDVSMGYMLIYGVFWISSSVSPSMTFGQIIIYPAIALALLPLWLPRIGFLYLFNQLYQNKASARKTFFLGIIGESYSVGVVILSLISLSYPLSMGLFTYAIPFPVVSILGFVIWKLFPSEREETWIQKEKHDSWWASSDDQSN